MGERQRLFLLILIMTTVSMVVVGITIFVLYHAAFEEERERLVETAQSQARLIEAIARFNAVRAKTDPGSYPGGPAVATLSQIIDAHAHYQGFGETGEFTLARRERDDIFFLLRHRHSDLHQPEHVPLSSNLAEPMRRALSGLSGTVVGLDYRGQLVLAAHEPVAELASGIVAKIDLAEIRAPFLRAGLMAICASLLVVFVGAIVFFRVSKPMVKRLEERTAELSRTNQQLELEIQERKNTEEALQEAHAELENRVEERTVELLQTNEQLLREIKVRSQLEEASRRAEEQYRLLVQNLPSIVYKGYKDWSVEFFDNKVETLMGYRVDDFHSQRLKWSDLIVEQDLETAQQEFVQALKSDKSYVREYRTRTKAGDVLWIQDRGQIILDEGGKIDHVSGAFFDVTDRKKAEEALRHSEKELRLLSSQLLTAQEQERGRIARELHDTIGQSLSAIKFRVEDALGQITTGSPESSVNSLNNLIPIIQSTVEEVRRITMDLRPATLDDLGILATVTWFLREYQKTYASVRIDKDIRIDESDVPEYLKIVIYRVLQEALNNVAKHSGADRLTVSLTNRKGKIELAVEDNGCGFDLEKSLSVGSAKRGFGLGSMKERIELSGGSFSLESVRQKGTVVGATWKI